MMLIFVTDMDRISHSKQQFNSNIEWPEELDGGLHIQRHAHHEILVGVDRFGWRNNSTRLSEGFTMYL
jgi:hypothetical protein